MAAAHKVTVALDYANLADVKSLVSQLNPNIVILKSEKNYSLQPALLSSNICTVKISKYF